MGKAALGKGMKDLLAKNFGLEEEKGPEKNKDKAKDELKVNIERYQAQGFNVEPLKQLKGKDSKIIAKGIEEFRAAVKTLNTAQTILRSLEGYGYTKEIESINDTIKDPSRADQVMRSVEELRDRAQTEHDAGGRKKESPGSKIFESLKEKSEKLKGNGAKAETVEIEEGALDDLLDDLDEIGDAFSLEIEEDPLLSRISKWEKMGNFVDKLKNTSAEDRDRAEKEAEQFEIDVERMESVKKLFKKMDLTGFQREAQELLLKFQYPHLAQDVENELKRIKSIQENADSLLKEEEESTLPQEKTPDKLIEEEGEGSGDVQDEIPESPVEKTPEEPQEEIEDVSQTDESPSVEPEEIPVSPEEATPEESEEVADTEDKSPDGSEDIQEGKVDNTSEVPPGESDFSSHSADELMDMAKEAYKEGRMEESLTLFKELLKKDPNSSKARFMIRRISSKLGQ
jgi:hypothetical protein